MDEAIEKEVNEIYEQALGTVSSLAAEGEDLYPFALTSVEAGEGPVSYTHLTLPTKA